MSAVLMEMAAEDVQTSSNNVRRYAELLLAGDESPEVLKELKALARELGKTPDQLRDDARAIERYREYCKAIENGTGLDEQRQKSQETVKASRDRTEAAIKKLWDAHGQLQYASSQLEERYLAGSRAINKLIDLKANNPHLLAGVDCSSLKL